jgi:hypothetical protein
MKKFGATVEYTADGLVRKYSRRVSQTEALNVGFVAANTTIPIPKLISCAPPRAQGGSEGYSILMTREKGETAEKAWPSLNEEERRTIAIVSKLSSYVS